MLLILHIAVTSWFTHNLVSVSILFRQNIKGKILNFFRHYNLSHILVCIIKGNLPLKINPYLLIYKQLTNIIFFAQKGKSFYITYYKLKKWKFPVECHHVSTSKVYIWFYVAREKEEKLFFWHIHSHKRNSVFQKHESSKESKFSWPQELIFFSR